MTEPPPPAARRRLFAPKPAVVRRVVLHRQAPPKPAEGAPCNGCGLCCADTLCPVGLLLYRRRNGPCPALRWQDSERRYLCGVLAGASRWRFRLLTRWISVGSGCDCGADVLGTEELPQGANPGEPKK